jgi:hypothetical protein
LIIYPLSFQEGQGSYFFSTKNQVFVGEWVDDMPKAGVYSEVDDPENPVPDRFHNNQFFLFIILFLLKRDSFYRPIYIAPLFFDQIEKSNIRFAKRHGKS